ncbi:B12-binding domain-containing protein [Psychrilyobacter sp.]|uniref:B12-binding domain-containing protein n=1 Tax=Psychrilyobacter sp. TaxID=2586924 RepID=UPI003015CE7C
MTKKEFFEEIKNNLIEMEEDTVEELCKKSLEMGIPAKETIQEGLIAGMEVVGQLYEEEEYFLPEVLICSDAMNIGIDILKPHLEGDVSADKIRAVIGVVEGDTHDIGKEFS